MAGQRPGGLTALAVLNFVGAGINLLATARNLYRVVTIEKVRAELATKADDASKLFTALFPPDWWFFFKALIAPILLFLLLVSGIGYLKRRKKMGFRMGIAYAVISIGESAIDMAFGGILSNMFDVVFLVYPLMTLVVLNFVFKDDFE